MNAITLGSSLVYNPTIQLQRTLRQEIAKIGEVLAASPLQDDLSDLIRHWHKKFTETLQLKNIDLRPVHQQFIEKLEEILVTPGLNIPLDEDTLLGSDGIAYGYKFLCVYRHKSKPPFHERSPLRPQDSALFITSPHDIARFLVSWLKKQRPDFGSEVIDKEFEQFHVVRPTPLQEKIQRIKQEQLLRKQQREERERAASHRYVVLEQTIDQLIAERIEPLNRAVADNESETNAALQAAEEKFRKDVESLQQKHDQLHEKGNALEADIESLKNQQKIIGEKIESAKADNIRLQIAIKETEKAINDRDKGWMGGLLQAALIVGAAWCATWAVSGLLASMGATSTTATLTSSKSVMKMALITTF